MRSIKLFALLLAAALLALCLTGCSSKPKDPKIEVKDDEQAKSLAYDLTTNHFLYFPRIEGVTELASPLCVILREKEGTGFLEDEGLSLAAPDSAKALLLVDLERRRGSNGDFEGDYDCDITYGTPDGSMSVVIAKDVALDKGHRVAELLSERYTFVEGEPALLTKLADYRQALEGRDYLTAINACRDAYQDPDVGPVDPADVADPLVYMVDADWECQPAEGNDLFTVPAEQGQYAPPEGSYARPEIGGSLSLGFASLGKQPDASGDAVYTLDEVNALTEQLPDTFCFSEITGRAYFGDFSSQSQGVSFTAHSYKMRISVIGMDGRLLGYRDMYYDPNTVDKGGLAGQFLGIKLSIDKYGDHIISWSYKSKFWEEVGK